MHKIRECMKVQVELRIPAAYSVAEINSTLSPHQPVPLPLFRTPAETTITPASGKPPPSWLGLPVSVRTKRTQSLNASFFLSLFLPPQPAPVFFLSF